MNFLNELLYNKEKNKIYLIGTLHSVMVCFGFWSLVLEILDREEPITKSDIVYIAVHYTIHFILILFLFVGTYTDTLFFLIPWLGASFLTYFYITALTLISLKSRKLHDALLYSMNFIYLSICWYSWYVVISYFMAAYRRRKLNYSGIY
ncbi:uncharacterized protein LOC108912846 [Anoplophora glabripennis]|uniref:uncharacterized protein LOC108912846 n=1 Tax=Anoplophora glabripennis TaxID=217634 RepID=UPI0008738E1D|nr:uncharacterized protein LOC108912846 [Anoplophora glabripennis]XP_018573763.1 uncharacterized protein LOC108912846 [Anoplophora glabripennis]XP_018573764.1 uncharacterized protein LOC108912846 [Anoplophora glabripennis]